MAPQRCVSKPILSRFRPDQHNSLFLTEFVPGRVLRFDLSRYRVAALHLGEEFIKVFPNFSIKEWARTETYTDRNELLRFVDGMRIAGLPE